MVLILVQAGSCGNGYKPLERLSRNYEQHDHPEQRAPPRRVGRTKRYPPPRHTARIKSDDAGVDWRRTAPPFPPKSPHAPDSPSPRIASCYIRSREKHADRSGSRHKKSPAPWRGRDAPPETLARRTAGQWAEGQPPEMPDRVPCLI